QLVFADADLDRALPFLVNAGIQNAGQTCSAASRILVERSRYPEVVERMAERYGALRVGPADADLDVGPLISARQKTVVEGFVAASADLQIAARGRIVADEPTGGHYVAPVLFADVPRDHRLAQDEIFGPVQVVIPFEDEADAVSIANGTGYGLVAGVWTGEGFRGAVRLLGAKNRRSLARVTDIMLSRKWAPACAALILSGCALAPESKTFYLSREDWTGIALSARGKLTVADSVAGAGPNTITIYEIGALGTAPRER